MSETLQMVLEATKLDMTVSALLRISKDEKNVKRLLELRMLNQLDLGLVLKQYRGAKWN